MRIVVLGGAGKMGCISVQYLANDPNLDHVVLADVDMDQASKVADFIDSPKIQIRPVDPKDPQAFDKAVVDCDACINSTIRHTNIAVMEACLRNGVHYTDLGGLFTVTQKQLKLHDLYRQSGLSAVLGMGSAPGIPNIQARYAADRMDTIESIKIYDGIMPPSPDDLRFTYSVPTIIDELTLEPMVFQDGEFLALPPLSGFEDYWFSPPIGLLPMHLSLHSEVATLPITFKDKGVRECFFKINYWGMAEETVKKIRVLADFGFGGREPVDLDGHPVVPRELMVALLSEFVPPITSFLSKPVKQPPDWTKEIVTEVSGTKDDKPITFRLGTLTCMGALPTGAAPAIAAIWLADGRIQPGVYPPEASIEPIPFFKELEKSQIYTQVTKTTPI